MEPFRARRVSNILLSSSSITTVDRASLSIWHFHQLLASYLKSFPTATDATSPDDKLETSASQLNTYDLDIDDGMVVKAIVCGDDAESARNNVNADQNDQIRTIFTPATQVAVVYNSYRIILYLDASSSSLTIDRSTGCLHLELLIESLEYYLLSLIQPMSISKSTFLPDIHLSVIVQGLELESVCVVIQDYQLTAENVFNLLQIVKDRLEIIEDSWAQFSGNTENDLNYVASSTPTLFSMLQNAIFALNSLPSDAAPILVIATDGVVSFNETDASCSYDSLLMQIIQHNIQCHFLQIGVSKHPTTSFGYVPDTELLYYISESTGGAVIDFEYLRDSFCKAKEVCSNNLKYLHIPMQINEVQGSIFLRFSSLSKLTNPAIRLEELACVQSAVNKITLTPLRPYRMWRNTVHEYRIVGDIYRFAEARVREGFIIQKVQANSDLRYTTESERSNTRDIKNVHIDIGGEDSGLTPIFLTVGFLLQWKQNVWVEYIASCNTEGLLAVPTVSKSAGLSTSSNLSSNTQSFLYQQNQITDRKHRTVLENWDIKINILASSSFIQSFDEMIGHGNSNKDTNPPITLGPRHLQQFINNVQNVDRVLLHLMTAATAARTSELHPQLSFTSSNNASSSGNSSSRGNQQSHPVFNIIGELSPVLWHRWLSVERFEVLCIVKNEKDLGSSLFYGNQQLPIVERSGNVIHLDSSTRISRRPMMARNMLHTTRIIIGVDKVFNRLVSVMSKWASQKLSNNVFLKLIPTSTEKYESKTKSPAALSGGIHIANRRRTISTVPASHNSGIGAKSHQINDRSGEHRNASSDHSLCFVRLEVKNKTLFAVHVAFFSTSASLRSTVLTDLKAYIVSGLNDIGIPTMSNPSSGNNSPHKIKSAVVLHRLISRLLVNHSLLLLQEQEMQDRTLNKVGLTSSVNSCCNGSELSNERQKLFLSYTWNSCWKWKLANEEALLSLMHQLHELCVMSGFWVVDWKFQVEENTASRIQSVIFAREIMLEDENGQPKTALIQYALRKVSNTCLMTSFWMEPRHGRAKLNRKFTIPHSVDKQDFSHFGLLHAIGNESPLDENFHVKKMQPSGQVFDLTDGIDKNGTKKNEFHERERILMQLEDNHLGYPVYLDESALIHRIRAYILERDSNYLSCFYTFDSIINYHAHMLSNKSENNIHNQHQRNSLIVGANWLEENKKSADQNLILPPFSTARLIMSSKRSTERFPMSLQGASDDISKRSSTTERETANSDTTIKPPILSPAVSQANENLYSMLERTLRGLSDCEVAWTDIHGNVLGSATCDEGIESNERNFSYAIGEHNDMPPWLGKDALQHLRSNNTSISRGKCFAKVLNDTSIVLAFLPALECTQILEPKKRQRVKFDSGLPKKMNDSINQKHQSDLSSIHNVEQLFISRSGRNAAKISASADDMYLFQERQLSYREGYKFWRMGHYQGSRDEKLGFQNSTSSDLRNEHRAKLAGHHELCDQASREAAYGQDFHILIRQSETLDGSENIENSSTNASEESRIGYGFFQVAFYECTLTRISNIRMNESRRPGHYNSSSRIDEDKVDKIVYNLFKPKISSSDIKSVDGLSPMGLNKLGTQVNNNNYNINSSTAMLDPLSAKASKKFQQKVKRAHEHNFSRGVYIALRDGTHVEQSDLFQALSSCIEIPVDLDITVLYCMLVSSKRFEGHTKDSIRSLLNVQLDKSLETLLGGTFRLVDGTKYYVFTGSEQLNYLDDTGENEEDMHLILEDDEQDEEKDDNALDSENNGMSSSPKLSAEHKSTSLPVSVSDTVKLLAPSAIPNVEIEATKAEASSFGSDTTKGSPITAIDRSMEDTAALEEDEAEFNKEVAVATSSFSAPLFLRLEYRERTPSSSASHQVLRPVDDLTDPSTASSDKKIFTKSFAELRKELFKKSPNQTTNLNRVNNNEYLQPNAAKEDPTYRNVFTEILASGTSDWFGELPSGGVALRLVTITLPNKQQFETDGGRLLNHSQHFSFDLEEDPTRDASSIVSARKRIFSTLPQFQRQLIKRLRQEIKEWCSIEILNILREFHTLNPPIGKFVRRVFRDLPAHSLTKVRYPFEFVPTTLEETIKDPMSIFRDEIIKPNKYFHVQEYDDAFFIVAPSVSQGGEQQLIIPYWAYFVIDNTHVQLFLHHPNRLITSTKQFDRVSILTQIHLGVRYVCDRVNQALLLVALHYKSFCNGLMVPAKSILERHAYVDKMSTTGSLSGSTVSEGNNAMVSSNIDNQFNSISSVEFQDDLEMMGQISKNGTGFFWPGRFACKLLYSSFFKLHDRMSPAIALNKVCTSALEQFQVHNRRYMFVYRDPSGNVFYMKIRLSPSPETQEAKISETARNSEMFNRQAHGLNLSINNANSSSSSEGILLEIFGVSEAGEEVTGELRRLLERKLDDETQLILMKLLARNSKFQLSASDISFVCPEISKPTQLLEFTLPSLVNDERYDSYRVEDIGKVLLQYITQTLNFAPYIRHMTNTEASKLVWESFSSHKIPMSFANQEFQSSSKKVELTATQPEVSQSVINDSTGSNKNIPRVPDSRIFHPALFGSHSLDAKVALQNYDWKVQGCRTYSWVYFTGTHSNERNPKEEHNTKTDNSKPVAKANTPEILRETIIDTSCFVLNLNPELRLATDFINRVGKGLAFLRIEIIQNRSTGVERKVLQEDSTEDCHARKHIILQDILPQANPHKSTRNDLCLIARYRLWIRGAVIVNVLGQVLESFLKDSIHDYMIEQTLRNIQQFDKNRSQLPNSQNKSCEPAVGTVSESVNNMTTCELKDKLPNEANHVNNNRKASDLATLKSLMVTSCKIPSISVVNIEHAVPISGWEIINIVEQLENTLNTLPHRLKPAVQTQSSSTCVDHPEFMAPINSKKDCNDGIESKWKEGKQCETFRLIPHFVNECGNYITDDTASDLPPFVKLERADSTRSDASELSVATTSASIIASSDSDMLGNPALVSHEKKFGENDLLLHQSPISIESNTSMSNDNNLVLTRKRSRLMYYDVRVSTKNGISIYMYNIAPMFTDYLLIRISRIITWSHLREFFLCTLLLVKCGLSFATTQSIRVVNPRDLYVTGVNCFGKPQSILPSNFLVSQIMFDVKKEEDWKSMMALLSNFLAQPHSISSVSLLTIEGSPLSEYLKDALIKSQWDSKDIIDQRSRSRGSSSMIPVSGNASLSSSSDGSYLPREGSGNSFSFRNKLSIEPNKTRFGNNIKASESINSPNHMKTSPNEVSKHPDGRLIPNKLIPLSNSSVLQSNTVTERAIPHRMNIASNAIGPGGGAATAVMVARARARGRGIPDRYGAARMNRTNSNQSTGPATNIAPWDLPLTSAKPAANRLPKHEVGTTVTNTLKGSADIEGNKSASADFRRQTTTQQFRLPEGKFQKSTTPRTDEVVRPRTSLSTKNISELSNNKSCTLSQNWSSSHRTCGLSYADFPWTTVIESFWGPSSTAFSDIQHKNAQDCRYSDERKLVTNKLKAGDCLRYHSDSFAKIWDDQTKLHFDSLSVLQLFNTIICTHANLRLSNSITPVMLRQKGSIKTLQPVPTNLIEQMTRCGHQIFQRRFPMCFVDRWEIAKKPMAWSIRSQKALNSTQVGGTTVEAYRSAMNLINVLSYKLEFVFRGYDIWAANLCTEYTLDELCGIEGKAMRDMKGRIMKSIFHTRMDTARKIHVQCAKHLSQLGFCQIPTISINSVNNNSCANQEDSPLAGLLDGDGVLDYFIYTGNAGGVINKNTTQSTTKLDKLMTEVSPIESMIVLVLKCDYHGVCLSATLVSRSDISVTSSMKSCSDSNLKQSISTKYLSKISRILPDMMKIPSFLFEFSVHLFQKCLVDWWKHNYNEVLKHTQVHRNAQAVRLVSEPYLQTNFHSTQNIVKGLQEFLQNFPKNTDSSSSEEVNCSIAIRDINLPQWQLEQDEAAIIPTTLLLRYIACHGGRYNTAALMPYGTPDALLCRSASGTFYHDMPKTVNCDSDPDASALENFGYSLILTTQESNYLGSDSIRLILLRSCGNDVCCRPMSPQNAGKEGIDRENSNKHLLTIEQTIKEAEAFTLELFQTAVKSYERDLLWSRLLFNLSTSTIEKVCQTISIPPSTFQIEIGREQLEKCLELSVCTDLEVLDPGLISLFEVKHLRWYDFLDRVREVYFNQMREYRFDTKRYNDLGEVTAMATNYHILLMCPESRDLMIHIMLEKKTDFSTSKKNHDSSSYNSTTNGNHLDGANILHNCEERIRIEICRREERPDRSLSRAQRFVITEFINTIIHWQWRSLLY